MNQPQFVFPIRIYYEDTDASGVAYHANYLRWFERARTEWLRSLDLGQEKLRVELGIAFTVANLEVDFRRPARLDDLLDVVTEVTQLRRASIVFSQVLQPHGGGEVLARATARVGCVGAVDFRPMALPKALFEGIFRWTQPL